MTFKVSIDGQTINTSFDSKDHNSTLEYLENHDIDVHYHCRDGFCGACRVKLNSGCVNYPQGEPLAFVREGEVLACCCIPASDIDITID